MRRHPMRTKYPIEYELIPKRIEPGFHRRLTLRLRNIGTEELSGLRVRLNPADDYGILPRTASHIRKLWRNQETTRRFQVSAKATGRVTVSIEGETDGKPSCWESPSILVTVGADVAELVSLFALTGFYPPAGQSLRCEARVSGLAQSRTLDLEFWAETPSGDLEKLAEVETRPLSSGEEASYFAEITPEEEGLHTIFGYLNKEGCRIDREMERVYVRGA
jgi:hypothetical protein